MVVAYDRLSDIEADVEAIAVPARVFARLVSKGSCAEDSAQVPPCSGVIRTNPGRPNSISSPRMPRTSRHALDKAAGDPRAYRLGSTPTTFIATLGRPASVSGTTLHAHRGRPLDGSRPPRQHRTTGRARRLRFRSSSR